MLSRHFSSVLMPLELQVLESSMDLPKHFQRFHRNIQLNDEREAKIRRGLERFNEFLTRDQLGDYVLSAPVPQGSYAQGTIVRPLRRDPDYDVDILLPLDLDCLMRERGVRDGNEVFAYLHKRLKTEYKAGVAKRNKCMRISYQEGFHVDLVPGQPLDNVGGPYKIIDRERNRFIQTNPLALTNWVSSLNDQTAGHFSPAITMFKRWRDRQRFARATAPRSIFITILAGTSYLQYAADSRIHLRTKEKMTRQNMVVDLGKTMLQYIRECNTWSGPTGLIIPGSQGEDLMDRFEAKTRFIERLQHFVEYSEKAALQNYEKFAINHWQRLFGDDFPRNA